MGRSYTVPENITEVRLKAWQTRRAKYGARGHHGAYSRGNDGALRLVIRLHNEGVLSEGQVATATGIDRVAIRRLAQADEAYPYTLPSPPVAEETK